MRRRDEGLRRDGPRLALRFPAQQCRRLDRQRNGDALDVVDGDVFLAAFQHTDVCAVNARLLC